jgi:uncharacterized protein HemX
MNCAETQLLLSERALAILDPERAAEVESHLSGCPECAARASESALAAGSVRAELERNTPITAPRADVAAILSLARHDSTTRESGSSTRPGAPAVSKPWKSSLLRWAPLAAAVFLAGAGVGALAMASSQADAIQRRLQLLEDTTPIIAEQARDEARAAVIPVSQHFAQALTNRDEKWLRELEDLVRYIRATREADAAAIESTRRQIIDTQGAVLQVMERVPGIR